jgi:hypothetical protein
MRILGILAFVIASSVWAQSKDAGKQPQQSADPCAQSCPASRPTAKEEEHEKPWEKTIAIWTIVLAFATIGLGGVALWQRYDLKGSGEKQLRAYVGITPDPAYPAPTLEEIHTEGFQFHIVNYGKTPAHNVVHEIAMGGWTEDNPILRESTKPEKGSRFVLHPGAHSEMKIARKTPFSQQELASIRSGELKIFVWGKIWYQDAFNQDRWTAFRWRQGGSALEWTEAGNDAT